MAQKDLTLAVITPVNGVLAGKEIQVLFNPAEYSIEKGNTYQSTALPGMPTPVTQFVNGNADTLTMELYFDTYAISSRHPYVTQREVLLYYTRQLSASYVSHPTFHTPPI